MKANLEQKSDELQQKGSESHAATERDLVNTMHPPPSTPHLPVNPRLPYLQSLRPDMSVEPQEEQSPRPVNYDFVY
ncbi:hypothetical protein V500_01005 [Pseudogymnoascus sp. VKM F-4518 (FW-2643)]|nr:hypothetical protein V500_01005 [Pseudogymnoascus sp. VKM F-4518 (FW-2643)]